MKKNDESNPIYFIIIAIGIVGIISGMFGYKTTVSEQDVINYNRNTKEYKSVERVINAHGYSGDEAKEIADAVIKFHNLQK